MATNNYRDTQGYIRDGTTKKIVGFVAPDGSELLLQDIIMGESAVLSVNTRTGNITLTSTDVGLGNVNNTTDANKPISTAQATVNSAVAGEITALQDLTPVSSLTGTADQIIASAATGDVTLSLPQSIAVTSTPTFAQATISNTPANPTDAVNKAYADAIAQGLQLKPAANEATTTALPTYVYANGSSGVGATLTGVATGVLTLDGQAVALDDVVLVKNETAGNAPYNGLYRCTVAGAIGVAYVLTRIVEMNAPAEFSGAFAFVVNGTVNASTGWACSDTGTIVVGTTNITFVQFSGAGTYTADGTTLQLIGTQFSLKGPVTEANGGTGAASIGLAIDAATAKTTLVDADETVLGDSAAAFATKKVTFANVFAYIKAKLVATANVWTKPQSGAYVALTSTSGSIAVDLSLSNNYNHTTTEATNLANPSNATAGQSCVFEFTQGSTPRIMTVGSFYKWAGGTVPSPVLTASGGAKDVMTCIVDSGATFATCTMQNGVA